jgi:beta-mannosidase
MKKTYDLSRLNWELTGSIPYLWEMEKSDPMNPMITKDVPTVKAKVPGSVQMALRNAGIIPDWNIGDNAKLCEWVENRHWIFKAQIPDEWVDLSLDWKLQCLGLDYSGWVYMNNKRIGSFMGTHIPHSFDIKGFITPKDNVIEIVFDLAPRWLGQFGYTSRITEWKTRFNYTWDWVPRLMQIGIWDGVFLEGSDGQSLENFRCSPDADLANNTGSLWLKGEVRGDKAVGVCCKTLHGSTAIAEKRFSIGEFERGAVWTDINADLWWPNLMGSQSLYKVECALVDTQGHTLDTVSRQVGFRHIEWQPCKNAPAKADPWLCVVNGKPVFLQGFNFQPIRSNYADLTREDYRKRLEIYKDIGTNCFRINACGYLEFECFYELCDKLGFMVWQEFPLTSSGIDNWPPEDPKAIVELAEIARSFIRRRQNHPSVLAWGGSNEQQGSMDGGKTGAGKPCTLNHPMLARLDEVVKAEDSGRRYIPTSPLGPVSSLDEATIGKGIHWDVHGPNINFPNGKAMCHYWAIDDALFRAEIYVSGAASADSIRRYKGEWTEMPASKANPMWKRPTSWWNDWDELIAIHDREPHSLEEYVQWSQEKQAYRLAYAMKACKSRFPEIGGSLMWGSHDTSPMPVNTTIIDFDGNPKSSAWALKKVWRPES